MDFAPLASLAAGQHGCFAHRQLPDIGLDRHQLRRLISATLSMPGSMASHRSAAALWGLEGFNSGRIEVVVEHGAWRRREVTIHQSKDLVAGDRDLRYGIACTSLVRTLVDLPAVTWEGRCGSALDLARRHDRWLFERVRARHLEVARRGRNGTVALRAILERRGFGDQLGDSGFEAKALDLISRACLPDPVTQHRVRDGEFVAYIDIAWPDRMVGMECDSLAYHFGEVAHQGDRTRRRRLTRLGWDMYEYTYQDVTKRPHGVAQELRSVLGC